MLLKEGLKLSSQTAAGLYDTSDEAWPRIPPVLLPLALSGCDAISTSTGAGLGV